MTPAQKRHYEDNKDLYKQRAYDRNVRVRKEMRDWVNDLKATVHCSDCGGKFPPVAMDFDHVGEKTDNVSRIIRKPCSWKTLFAEILQCEIVCSNCHRVRTSVRLVV